MVMELESKLKKYQQKLISCLRDEQFDDGSWNYPCENGPITDAYMIIVLTALNYQEEPFITMLANRILSTQLPNGAWKLYEDEEEGNLSATIEAYTALLFSEKRTKNHKEMKLAENFILKQGGVKAAHVSTKFMLALNGLYPWPTFFPIPLTTILLPKIFPSSFENMTSYVKVHFASVLVAAKKRFAIKNSGLPSITHLILEDKVKRRLSKQLEGSPYHKTNFLQRKALQRAENYILDRIEGDGTLGSYVTATVYMIYSLLAFGYDATSPLIKHAINGIKKSATEIDKEMHIQNASSTIWDTALITYALQEAGVPASDSIIRNAAEFLLKQQQQNNESNTAKGAWSFSHNNSSHPDIDDTQVALRAIQPFTFYSKDHLQAWNKGLTWLLSMQNKDGGWSSFDKNKGKHLIANLPIPNIKDTAIDPSTADLTGRTLQFLGKYVKMNDEHPRVSNAVKWLLKNQEESGAWYGRWGVCYIYGTWAAVTGLRSVGVLNTHVAIKRAEEWLISVQNTDGGWGESCKSDVERTFVGLPISTLPQTAWALDALISINDEPSVEINRGITFLLDHVDEVSYPTGGGLPGTFYINYHSYNTIWPLLAVSHYLDKYGRPSGR
ncbi:prenyltransferase/squalene oxidase repeat-containing protein [Evansella sp. AB-rgal1]|uniref:terpene cyclase/mutase family protein n=1 Tax=Evansella sp. AB-rgal1 TaxID=3242696 RepID=UPI00359EC2BA